MQDARASEWFIWRMEALESPFIHVRVSDLVQDSMLRCSLLGVVSCSARFFLVLDFRAIDLRKAISPEKLGFKALRTCAEYPLAVFCTLTCTDCKLQGGAPFVSSSAGCCCEYTGSRVVLEED